MEEGRIMDNIIKFENRTAFRKWLQDHCLSTDGVWLLFGKSGGPKTIKANEAFFHAQEKQQVV